ncbi:hypothetical protein D3C78_1336820 [compost metagenome]
MLEQRINQNAAEGAEKEQQIAELIHGKHRAAPSRPHARSGQQGHDRQRPAAATGSRAVGEFGGHHYTKALQRRDALALIAE